MASEMQEVLTRLDRIAIDLANNTIRQNQLESTHEKSFNEIKELLVADRRIEKLKGVTVIDDTVGEIYSPTEGPTNLAGNPSLNSLPQKSLPIFLNPLNHRLNPVNTQNSPSLIQNPS